MISDFFYYFQKQNKLKLKNLGAKYCNKSILSVCKLSFKPTRHGHGLVSGQALKGNYSVRNFDFAKALENVVPQVVPKKLIK